MTRPTGSNESSTTGDSQGDVIERFGRAQTQALHYSRQRFLGTWLAIALLAIGTCLAVFLALRAADTNLDQTDDIARLAHDSAKAAQKTSDDTVAYLRGETGIPGVPGADGEDGTPGLPGTSEPGAPGEPGRPGERGETGSTGGTGESGSAGAQGPPGAAGAMGEPGTAGAQGEKGADGSSGTAGESGPKGEPGESGPMGVQGPAGPVGPVGPAAPAVVPTTAAAASANDTTVTKNVTATCADGKRVTGGGYAIVPNSALLVATASTPVGVTGWQVTATAGGALTWQLLVFAVCA